jgi:hypothetical protein
VFHSPVADYHGRDRVLPVLSALATVLTQVAPIVVLEGPDQSIAFFGARIQEHHADGVLRVVAASDGPATELTLMIRPLAALVAGVEQMKEVLGGTSHGE